MSLEDSRDFEFQRVFYTVVKSGGIVWLPRYGLGFDFIATRYSTIFFPVTESMGAWYFAIIFVTSASHVFLGKSGCMLMYFKEWQMPQ